uniref:Uncharacterized protein n=1 Tax=Trieres chinensis TaxID=1514140 RepID=A0A7S2A936_TRICV|mmetsp:Transcript_8197/g.17322  ORF Transcript_8197/g.17322 Transcript_8197/m.17322 type:complete len:118 (+) Transcript_8197:184-537(+)
MSPVGGGLMTHWEYPRYMDANDGQVISIYDTDFVGNSGGGFMATNIGALPSLRVWQSDFTENSPRGIDVCCRDKGTYDAILCDNQGTDSGDQCESIQIYGETNQAWCLFFDEDHPQS